MKLKLITKKEIITEIIAKPEQKWKLYVIAVCIVRIIYGASHDISAAV